MFQKIAVPTGMGKEYNKLGSAREMGLQKDGSFRKEHYQGAKSPTK